jgi:predicted N-acetyltransferase YhbS
LQLTRYEKVQREETFAFLRAVHSPSVSERLMRQWDWKYDANPFNRYPEPYILLLRDGARVIGMLGAMFLRVSVNGRECWVTHSCDLAVLPGYRGQGLGRRIVRQYVADNPMGFGWVNELSHGAVAPMRNWGSTRVDSLVRPIDFAGLLHCVTGSRLLGHCAGLLTKGRDRMTRALGEYRVPAGMTISRADQFGRWSDNLWGRACRGHPVMVVRGQEYLSWRFVRRPHVKYGLLLARTGDDVLGYVVTRLAQRAGLLWGYLVDLLVENSSHSLMAALIREATRSLVKQGAAAVSCLATTPPFRRALFREGFLPWRWGRPTYFHTRVDLPDPTLQAFRDPPQWFLTMGDGDLEMAF